MKVLYYYSQLNIGGAERSTVRLLNLLAEKGHDVTLLLRWNGGGLESTLNKNIKVLHLKKSKNGKMGFVSQISQTIFSFFREKKLKKEEYDIVISGLFGYDPKILFSSLKAKQYYQLLRNDVEKTGGYGKTQQYMSEYGDKFDAYIGVSKYTTESFKRCYPQYKDRAYTIYNILPTPPKKDTLTKPQIIKDDEKLKILTVCRLVDKAKGLFRMINVCSNLVKEFGNSFVWYIVGNGSDRDEIERRIKESELENTMVLCGETDNPFDYYANVDLVAVLSYYEGLCGVVNEAKMMEKPLIATRFSGIDEQITDGINGYIVENDEKAIIEKMRFILQQPNILENFKINGMPTELLDNDKKVEQYVELFEKIKGEKNGR